MCNFYLAVCCFFGFMCHLTTFMSLANQSLLVDVKCITTSMPAQKTCCKHQIKNLWYTTKYREIYLGVIGLTSIVLTRLAKALM